MAAQQVIETYYNTLKHLRVAQPFIEDIAEIDAMIVNFDYYEAEILIDYMLAKHEQDFTLIGKHLTGVLIKYKKDVPTKNGADLRNDLIYLKNCIIISGAVHCGLEDTIYSAIRKINRSNKN